MLDDSLRGAKRVERNSVFFGGRWPDGVPADFCTVLRDTRKVRFRERKAIQDITEITGWFVKIGTWLLLTIGRTMDQACWIQMSVSTNSSYADTCLHFKVMFWISAVCLSVIRIIRGMLIRGMFIHDSDYPRYIYTPCVYPRFGLSAVCLSAIRIFRGMFIRDRLQRNFWCTERIKWVNS